jgi:hypothetical protein
VLFGGGPGLERGTKLFLSGLESHPQIELAAAVFQSPGLSRGVIVRDLWRRRGVLALPLLLVQSAGWARRALASPSGERELRDVLGRLEDRIEFVDDIHAPDVLERVGRLDPDLGLVYGSPILRPELFELPRLGTFGIHHGKLPEYRGKKTTFWAMYNGETNATVTIQRINRKLDRGDVVRQGDVAAAGRSYGRVWRELEELGADLYVQAVLEARAGTARYLEPEGRRRKLYRDPRPRDLLRFYWRRLVSGRSR